jgi:hypothetical protein
MEADDIPEQPTKRVVSEKVLANLAKAQARRKELHQQRLQQREQEKSETKKMKKVAKIKQQLVELVGDPELETEQRSFPQEEPEEPEEKSEPEVEQEMAPEEPVVVVKKSKPPVEKVVKQTYTEPKVVKERHKPAPSQPPRPNVVYV